MLSEILRALFFGNLNKDHQDELIRYQLITLALVIPAVILLVLSEVLKNGSQVQHWCHTALPYTVIFPVGYTLYLGVTRNTYWGYKLAENKEASHATRQSKAELLAFAEEMKRKTK